MAYELNPVSLDALPTVDSLLSSDSIVVFDEKNGKLSPKMVSILDLSACVCLSGDIEEIESKANAIEEMLKQASLYLQKNFILKTDAASQYSTATNLDSLLTKLETTLSFTNRLKNKANSEYLEYLYNKIRADCQRAKARLGDANWIEGEERGLGYKIIAAMKADSKE